MAGAFSAVCALAGLASNAVANHSAVDRVSAGAINGNGALAATFAGSSADGTRVFFTTLEQLVSTDTDSQVDVYERSGGTTKLVSAGQINGNGALAASFVGSSDDGTRVFFTTNEPLVPADTDSSGDVYERSGGTTTLVSAGQINGNGLPTAAFDGSSADGTRVFFHTAERLVAADTDTVADVYERSGGTTTLVSTGPAGGNGSFAASFAGASSDGTHVFLQTDEQLVVADTDGSTDVYDRSAGTTALLSTGPAGGNGSFPASFARASQDGTSVVFSSDEQLVGADTDGSTDVYQRSGGTTTLASAGQINGNGAVNAVFAGATPDATHVLFTTAEQLDAADTDSSVDVYDRSGGATTLVSAGQINGNGAFGAGFAGVSQDGTHVFFATNEPLVAADIDSAQDIYERSGGTTRLLSTGTGVSSPGLAAFAGASADGTRVFFRSTDELVAADTDGSLQDVYERAGATTTLISIGPNGGNGPIAASPAGNSRDGTKVFFTTTESLVAGDTDSSADVYVAAAFPLAPYPTPASASSLSVALVPAFRQTISASQCSATGRTPTTHGAPFSVTSCNPPAFASGTIAFFGRAAQGTATLTVTPGDPLTTANEADDTVSVSLTDIRSGSITGADYNPNPGGADVTLLTKLRISDLYNGGSLTDPGTAADLDLAVPVTCSATASTDVGASCSVTSTVNAIAPGAIVEGRQTVVNAFRFRLNDAGSNGTRGDADDRNFAMQGAYTP